MNTDEDLDQLVRRVDPDRWLASRFIADAEARADMIALYAFNYELSRAAEASQPLVGEIRLTWWREAVGEVFEGRSVRRHPGVQALALAIGRRSVPRAALDDLIDARLRDLDGWPLDGEEIIPYADATAGAVMMLAGLILAPGVDPHAFKHAGRAWGLAGLSRVPGRLPTVWRAMSLKTEVEGALAAAHTELAGLPIPAFPAAAYATLARPYALRNQMTDLGKRVRITWAVLRGRI